MLLERMLLLGRSEIVEEIDGAEEVIFVEEVGNVDEPIGEVPIEDEAVDEVFGKGLWGVELLVDEVLTDEVLTAAVSSEDVLTAEVLKDEVLIEDALMDDVRGKAVDAFEVEAFPVDVSLRELVLTELAWVVDFPAPIKQLHAPYSDGWSSPGTTETSRGNAFQKVQKAVASLNSAFREVRSLLAQVEGLAVRVTAVGMTCTGDEATMHLQACSRSFDGRLGTGLRVLKLSKIVNITTSWILNHTYSDR